MQKMAIGDFGCIFAGLESLLLRQTGIAPSFSEMLLKIFRSSDPTTEYNSEHAFFRKVREESLTEGELIDRFQAAGFDITLAHLDYLDDVPAEEHGAWCSLHGFVQGIKLKVTDEPELMSFLDFLTAHCRVERDLIKTLKAKNTLACKDELASWILIDPNNIDSDVLQDKVNHLAAVIFYWAALYDKYLQIEHPDLDWAYTENKSPSLLVKYLPKLDTKGKKIINSTWGFVESYKDYLLSEGMSKISDTYFCERICDIRTDANDEPSKEGIEKTLKNIKSGKSPLTINFALKNLLPLTGREVPLDYQWESSLMIIHFLNLFSKIQAIALKGGLSNTDTIVVFDRYHQYVDVVHRRFQSYEHCGILAPIPEQLKV
jgi:hypothetical protein